MKDLKVFKKLQLMAAALGVGFVLSNPMVTFAEESVGDVLYEQETDEHEEVDIVETPEEKTEETEKTETPEETEKKDETDKKEDTEKKEFGKDEFIDADNWSPEIDIDPNAGLEIPDTVATEAERKGIKPLEPETPSTPDKPHKSSESSTPETPSIPQIEQPPIPVPQTGEGVGSQVASGIISGLLLGAMALCIEQACKTFVNGKENEYANKSKENKQKKLK